MFMNYLGFPLI